MVYFIEAVGVGMIKIGSTKGDPGERLANLQTASPVPLRLIGSTGGDRRNEFDFHRKFASIRSHGEWFHATKELRDFVDKMTSREAVPGISCPVPQPPRKHFVFMRLGRDFKSWVDRLESQYGLPMIQAIDSGVGTLASMKTMQPPPSLAQSLVEIKSNIQNELTFDFLIYTNQEWKGWVTGLADALGGRPSLACRLAVMVFGINRMDQGPRALLRDERSALIRLGGTWKNSWSHLLRG